MLSDRNIGNKEHEKITRIERKIETNYERMGR